MSAAQVGNEFILPRPKMKIEVSVPAVEVSPKVHVSSGIILDPSPEPEIAASPVSSASPLKNFVNLLHQHSFIVFAVAFLVIGAAGTKIAANYWTATHITNSVKPAAALQIAHPTIAGLNTTIPQAELQSKLQTITTQPTTLTVGTQAVPVSSDTIRSWLQITSNKSKSEYYVHVNEAAISASLAKQANNFVKSPVNQVTVNEDGADRVVAAGRNGTTLSDPNSLKIQAQQIAKTVMDGKGMQFTTPLQTVPFQAVTPAAFSKLLVADITTKKMWAYENGQLVKTFLISAGAPATPTPIGQYHVYAKYSVQDMRGTNPNGTPYFQPRVPWVNYFTAGDAVHGVYWHPASYFGNINSSHGCVGIPVDQAEWVYDWAPIGTTVITHA